MDDTNKKHRSTTTTTSSTISDDNGNGKTLTITKDIKIPLKMVGTIIVGAFILGGAWFDLHIGQSNLSKEINGVMNVSMRVSEFNEYVLREQLANITNHIIFIEPSTVIHRNTTWADGNEGKSVGANNTGNN